MSMPFFVVSLSLNEYCTHIHRFQAYIKMYTCKPKSLSTIKDDFKPFSSIIFNFMTLTRFFIQHLQYMKLNIMRLFINMRADYAWA